MYTIQHIISHSKGNVYAPQNAQVTLIHTVAHVAICEYNGERFPCTVDLLSDEPVAVEVVVKEKVNKVRLVAPKQPKVTVEQISLL